MTKLGVNIDHSATLRQARYCDTDFNSGIVIEPDIFEIAKAALKGGADSITVHLREDRRHIRDCDVLNLTKNLGATINMEMACTEEMVQKALEYKPAYVCVVPENRKEVTTEGGLNVVGKFNEVLCATKKMQDAGIRVSLFIDPDLEQIAAAKKAGAQAVELHTGAYANAWNNPQKFEAEKQRLRIARNFCEEQNLIVNAGHGLNYKNLPDFKTLGEFNELNIGHTIVCRALLVGMECAVREMKELVCK